MKIRAKLHRMWGNHLRRTQTRLARKRVRLSKREHDCHVLATKHWARAGDLERG